MNLDKISKFITTLIVHFPKRHATPADQAEWLTAMAHALQSFDPSILDLAARKIIDTRTDRFFPLPAECRKFCNEVARDEAERKPRLDTGNYDPVAAKWKEWSQDRIAWADRLIQSEMGRRAAREGWISTLHDFIRVNNRMPKADHEIATCIRIAAEFMESYEDAVRGGWQQAASLASLGEKMLAKREKLSVIANNAA